MRILLSDVTGETVDAGKLAKAMKSPIDFFAAAGVVAAPAIAVGALAGAAVVGVNAIVEGLTGKDVGEWVADGVCDAVGAVADAAGSVADWFGSLWD